MFDSIRGLTVVYGPAASGKTTLCMQMAGKKLAQQHRVLYIDAEHSLNLGRFREVTLAERPDMDLLLVLRPKTLNDLHGAVMKLPDLMNRVKLIVVDTIGTLYRREAADDLKASSSLLERQMRMLSEISRRVPVIVANQVGSILGSTEVRMVGGKLVEKWASTLIELKREPRMMLIKRPEERRIPFSITASGIVLESH